MATVIGWIYPGKTAGAYSRVRQPPASRERVYNQKVETAAQPDFRARDADRSDRAQSRAGPADVTQLRSAKVVYPYGRKS